MPEIKEQLESVQAHLPAVQSRWLRSKAELRGSSLSAELRRCVFIAQQVEALAGAVGENIHYITAPAA
jgi:hypothetical protein